MSSDNCLSRFSLTCAKQRLIIIWKNITVEPLFILYMLNYGIFSIVSQTLYIEKICKVNLNFTDTICDNIQNHNDEQIQVQKYSATLKMYNSVLQAIPGTLYLLIAGPLSDVYGRKPFIAFALFGYVLSNAVFLINGYFFYELKAEYLLFECFQDVTGGGEMFFAACYSYITDITSEKNRTKRFAYLDGLWPIGFFTGMILGGLIKDKFGYMYNFALGMLVSVLAMVYALVIVKDSRILREVRQTRNTSEVGIQQNHEKNHEVLELLGTNEIEVKTICQKCLSIFDPKTILGSWKACIKPRPYYKRALLWLCISIFLMQMFIFGGRYMTLYLFFRRTLKWDMTKYTNYFTVIGLLGLATPYLILPALVDHLKFKDTTILLCAVSGTIITQFVDAFATYDWQIYVGGLPGILGVCITTLARSMMTKLVGPLEIGKVLAMNGCIQALMPFVTSPTFGMLYKSTVEDFPQAFLLLIIGAYLIIVILTITVRQLEDKAEKLKSLEERDARTKQ